ncbi:hypothetical protein LCGC14_2043650, partial [marine sediment metagenome]
MLKLVEETNPMLHKTVPVFDFEAVHDGFETTEEYLVNVTDKMFETMRHENG